MQKLVTEVLTFLNGTPRQVAFAGRACRMIAEPDDANTHVSYVGLSTMALGTSTVVGVVKRLAKPSAADALLDNYDVQDQSAANNVRASQYFFDGTTGEKVRVTLFTN